jgi:hypothetical protein
LSRELKYSRTACTLRFQFTGRLALEPDLKF